MDKYEFNLASAELYNFVWEDFCSSYIELAKTSLDNNTTKSILYTVLLGILKMLNPFMPFVTEEIYSMLPIKEQESIMLETYPKYDKKLIFKDEMLAVEEVLKDIVAIRNLKANNKITKEAKLTLNISDDNFKSIYFQQLKINEELIIDTPDANLTASNYKSKYIDITYYTETEPVDTKALEEEIKKLEASIARRQNLLSNENYVNKAPANIVEMDRKKLEEEQEKLANLKAQM